MSEKIGFCVIYHWKLRPGLEAQSVAAWKRGTQLIMQHRGALGSRLHKAEDGTWHAYAQWPRTEAWQAHRAAAPIDSEVARLMVEAEEMEFPPICLTPVADFLLCSRRQLELDLSTNVEQEP